MADSLPLKYKTTNDLLKKSNDYPPEVVEELRGYVGLFNKEAGFSVDDKVKYSALERQASVSFNFVCGGVPKTDISCKTLVTSDGSVSISLTDHFDNTRAPLPDFDLSENASANDAVVKIMNKIAHHNFSKEFRGAFREELNRLENTPVVS